MDKTTALVPMTGQQTQTSEQKIIRVPAPVFIVFAEYMGYVSELLDEATNLCYGIDVSLYVQNLMKVDAAVIYHAMLKEYTKEDIRSWFETYYPVLEMLYSDTLPKI